jgi:hypothetical protein
MDPATAPKPEAGMPFDKAVGFAIDYTKFIQTLWAAYIAFTVATVGWLVSFVTKPASFEDWTRIALAVAFCIASGAFACVLHINHWRLIKLMNLVDVLAKQEDRKFKDADDIYSKTFTSGPAPAFLHGTEWLILPVAGLMTWFICMVGR